MDEGFDFGAVLAADVEADAPVGDGVAKGRDPAFKQLHSKLMHAGKAMKRSRANAAAKDAVLAEVADRMKSTPLTAKTAAEMRKLQTGGKRKRGELAGHVAREAMAMSYAAVASTNAVAKLWNTSKVTATTSMLAVSGIFLHLQMLLLGYLARVFTMLVPPGPDLGDGLGIFLQLMFTHGMRRSTRSVTVPGLRRKSRGCGLGHAPKAQYGMSLFTSVFSLEVVRVSPKMRIRDAAYNTATIDDEHRC